MSYTASKFKKPFNFLKNQNGATAISFSLAAVALFAAAGLAIDFGRLHMEKSKLQAMLDAALVSGASSSAKTDEQIVEAKKYFDANSGSSADRLNVSFSAEKSLIVGKITTKLKSSLLAVVGIDEFDVAVGGKATSQVSYEPMCFTSMHPTRKHTLELHDSVSVIAPNCNFYGNSDHFNDVVDPHTSNNFMVGRTVAARGGGHHFIQNVTPAVQFGVELVTHPLPGVSAPSAPACIATDTVISSETVELPEGHYCDGLNIASDSTVTLVDGGKYFISGGALEIEQSTLEGKNVTLFMMDSKSKVVVKNSLVKLAAPKSGTYAGIAVFGLTPTNGNLIDDAKMDIHGVIFLPNADFVWNNVSDYEPKASWSSYVVDGVSWTGTGTVRYNFDLNASDIPFPGSMRAVPVVGDIRLVN